MSRQRILRHLEALVGFDTQNPPREIDGDADIFAHCREAVASGFEVRSWDHGDGHVSWLAVRGRPSVLFNAHLDTVPAGDGWNRDPHTLAIEDGRAFGRGACDIKGAAACLLAIAEQAPDHMALLFTTDEEGAGGCCVRKFLEAGEGEPFGQVVVAEPTGCRAVLGHRGYLSVRGSFEGVPGHSSEARALEDNAIHQMVRWAAAALAFARQRKADADDPGPCLNIGLARGGTKSNVIAGEAFVHWSARLPPGEPNDEFLAAVQACAGERAK
ncbi:MAG: M20/M25/M40 family metallo-hydrolase, partial [Xanthomonadales bacterium]|nr:M20/M25/M40 family metallo-hydrolase [Xanthomonadales bacterium]